MGVVGGSGRIHAVTISRTARGRRSKGNRSVGNVWVVTMRWVLPTSFSLQRNSVMKVLTRWRWRRASPSTRRGNVSIRWPMSGASCHCRDRSWTRYHTRLLTTAVPRSTQSATPVSAGVLMLGEETAATTMAAIARNPATTRWDRALNDGKAGVLLAVAVREPRTGFGPIRRSCPAGLRRWTWTLLLLHEDDSSGTVAAGDCPHSLDHRLRLIDQRGHRGVKVAFAMGSSRELADAAPGCCGG